MSDDSNELEERLIIGIQGVPEIKHEEKVMYLGEFRERILKVLSKAQLADSRIYPQIEASLRDPRAAHLLLNGEQSFDFREKYIHLAHKYNLPYTMVHDTEQEGEIGLAVISNQAVDIESITVPDLTESEPIVP